MGPDFRTWRICEAEGATLQFRTIRPLRRAKLRSKKLLADSMRAIFGSINLSPDSFDACCELAIETSNRGAVRRLKQYALMPIGMLRVGDLRDAGLIHDVA